MKIIKLILAIALPCLWMYFLNRPIVTKSSTIPALGPFMCPATGFWHNETLPDVEFGHIKSSVLIDSAHVIWDTRLVPHVFSQNDHDIFYLQGYSTASQRLWQMDMLARSAGGRLAEVLGGERLIARDKQQRRSGMLMGAENAVKGWKTEGGKYKMLEAYCSGINDYIATLKSKDLPIEYKLMGFQPEPWTVLKTACIVKYMAQSLCSRESDLEASNSKKMFGDSLFNFLYPSTFDAQSPVIPKGTAWDFIPPKKDTASNLFSEFKALYKRSSEVPPAGLGSNNWALSGTKTLSGHPILCNDPHLKLTLPSIWFEIRLNTPDMNAYGVSIPGVPGIAIGFNDSIAWGETNVGQDVADWYQISWADSARTKYRLDDNIVEVDYRIEEIKIKNKPSIFDTIKLTAFGPVVSEKLDDPYKGLAYHWIAHEIPTRFDFSAFWNLMKARNYLEYRTALKDYSNPAQNFIFASRAGDIAITVNGKFPIKSIDQGRFVQDGSHSQNAWKGYIPVSQNPHIKNPTRGFVSSANQNSTDPSYPYYYNGDFENFRGRVVNNLLEGMNKISVPQMMAMQNSTFSLKAKENLPIMLNLLDTTLFNVDQKRAFNQLSLWDFNFNAESNEAMIFNTWYKTMYQNLFDELYKSKDSSELLYPKTIVTSTLLSKYPQHKIFDILSTPKIEIAKDIIQLSFLETMNDLKAKGIQFQTWSDFTHPRIQHMANLPGFSSQNLKAGGISDALNALYNGSGPSWRMIVSLAEDITADVIYPGGQSGNPGSKYYDNMIQEWTLGKYQKANFGSSSQNILSLGNQSFSH